MKSSMGVTEVRKSYNLVVLTILFLNSVVVMARGGSVLPTHFDQICRIQNEDLQIEGRPAASILCKITSTDNQVWRLDLLRDWMMTRSENVSYDITCDQSGGSLSLPLPIKCPGLVSLTITNCNITDVFADFGNPVIKSVPSTLKKLKVVDSRMVQKRSNIFEMFAKIDQLTSHYECLHDETLEEMVFRNVSYLIDDDLQSLIRECLGSKLDSEMSSVYQNSNASVETRFPDNQDLTTDNGNSEVSDLPYMPSSTPTTSKDNSSPLNPVPSTLQPDKPNPDDRCAFLNFQKVLDVPKSLNKLDIKCNYVNLRVLEDTSNSVLSILETKFLAKYNRYPSLQVFNYSNNNIEFIPPELMDWSFLFDAIQTIDLSHNLIRKIAFKPVYVSELDNVTYVSLQYNNITTLSSSDLENFKKQRKSFFDIRNNPINCNCDLSDFIKDLSKPSVFRGWFKKYDYLQDMVCQSPARLIGRPLKSLTAKDLGCHTDDGVVLFVVLGVISLLLTAIVILAFLYRREIKLVIRSRLAKEQKSNKPKEDDQSKEVPQTIIHFQKQELLK